MRGADKLLEPVGGVPVLRHLAVEALAAGLGVIVTLPVASPRAAALAGLSVTIVTAPDAAEGMAASIRRGVAAAADAAGVMLLPADMPDLGRDDLRALADAWDGHEVLRAAGDDGTPGHPVIFPASAYPALARLAGDTGARALTEGARTYPLPGRRALTDLDTPEAWAAWRVRT